jgi:hypothetical protein
MLYHLHFASSQLCQNPHRADCHPQYGGNRLLLNMATQCYYMVCKPTEDRCGVLRCHCQMCDSQMSSQWQCFVFNILIQLHNNTILVFL